MNDFPNTSQVRKAFTYASKRNNVLIVSSKTRFNPPIWHLPAPVFQSILGSDKRLLRKIDYTFSFTANDDYLNMLDDAEAILTLHSTKMYVCNTGYKNLNSSFKTMFVYCKIK
jgi:hypothetical protein